MRATLLVFVSLLMAVPALSQPPGRPPLSIDGPDLGYRAVADPFQVPDGFEFASVASVAITPGGNLMVLNRGDQAFIEFDGDGGFIRSFGEGMFGRAHGLRYDDDGNMWVTDGGRHTAMKLSPDGEVLISLGTAGESGLWDEAAGVRMFDEPNDIATSSNGDVFIVQLEHA